MRRSCAADGAWLACQGHVALAPHAHEGVHRGIRKSTLSNKRPTSTGEKHFTGKTRQGGQQENTLHCENARALPRASSTGTRNATGHMDNRNCSSTHEANRDRCQYSLTQNLLGQNAMLRSKMQLQRRDAMDCYPLGFTRTQPRATSCTRIASLDTPPAPLRRHGVPADARVPSCLPLLGTLPPGGCQRRHADALAHL